MSSEDRMELRPAVILFVDDEASLRIGVKSLFQLAGFQVLLAASGREALQQLETASPLPDLIISDITMPYMNGFELFEAVRERPAWTDIPFVFLTASDQIEDLRRGYALGADDYVVKPFDGERLLLVIRSKLKRREEWLEHLRDQQRALDTARRDLVMLVAHELRTPLMSINMVIDILSREFDQLDVDQVHEMLGMMQGGSARMTRLVEQMVMYVQLQSGALGDSIRRQVRPGAVHEVVAGAIDRVQQFDYRQRQVPVNLDERDPGLVIRGDRVSLRHALAELLLNAITFSSPGSPVEVTQWGRADAAFITIHDHGVGIAPEDLDRVFEPFYQADRVRYEQQGIGIGLTLAKGIIEAHGGSLTLESRLHFGTLVTVTLPVVEPSKSD